MTWRSPITGHPLRPAGHALIGPDGERWPLVDEIAFLRADRRALADAALAALDAGDLDGALVLLLADQDPWARDAPSSEPDRRTLVRDRARLTFRDAMSLLALGPVADYFAHRWSDPTFSSGLALLEAHGGAPARAVEIGCGAGHFLRVLARRVPYVVGGDIVFAKLWLARHWIAPSARLVCFDAAASWPIPNGPPCLVFCHDAFYFLPDKPAIAAEMRRVAGSAGRILIGHAHNALVDNLSSGAPLAPDDYAALFAPARLYDDAELTRAFVQDRAPVAASVDCLKDSAAISLAHGAGPATRDRWADPPRGARLVRNPIYVAADDGTLIRRFPSDRYAREYGSLATYPPTTRAPKQAVAGEIDPALIRARVMLDLPARW